MEVSDVEEKDRIEKLKRKERYMRHPRAACFDSKPSYGSAG